MTTPSTGGYLVIKRPWPSMLRTIWGDNERYIKTYWEKYQNRFYVAGDSAMRDADGYYWIMGRIDDVLNVAGHRLGTAEIESALVAHPRVAEAAVVSRPHDVKGESVFAYVVLNIDRPDESAAATLIEELRRWVGTELSPIAKPDEIRLSDNLPKTRSGKIMRRLLRAIARGEDITQDVSTLENPAILEQLRAAPSSVAAPVPVAAVPAGRSVRKTTSVRRATVAGRSKPAGKRKTRRQGEDRKQGQGRCQSEGARQNETSGKGGARQAYTGDAGQGCRESQGEGQKQDPREGGEEAGDGAPQEVRRK